MDNDKGDKTLKEIEFRVIKEIVIETNIKLSIINALVVLFLICFIFAVLTDWFLLYILGLTFMYLGFFFYAIPTIYYCFKPSAKLADFLEKQGLSMQPRSKDDSAYKYDFRNNKAVRIISGIFLSLLSIGSIILIFLMFS